MILQETFDHPVAISGQAQLRYFPRIATSSTEAIYECKIFLSVYLKCCNMYAYPAKKENLSTLVLEQEI